MKKNVTTKEIKSMKYNLKIISVGSILFVLIFSYIFHKYAVKHEHQMLSIFLVTVIPIIAIIYNLYHNSKENNEPKNRRIELKEINDEMKSETKFYEIIAFLLFGLGLIYAEFKKFKYLSMVLPYLLFALLFGTILTSYMKQFIFDFNNLERLFNIDVLIFSASSLAVGLLTAGLFVPILYHSSIRGIAG